MYFYMNTYFTSTFLKDILPTTTIITIFVFKVL